MLPSTCLVSNPKLSLEATTLGKLHHYLCELSVYITNSNLWNFVIWNQFVNKKPEIQSHAYSINTKGRVIIKKRDDGVIRVIFRLIYNLFTPFFQLQ